MSLVQPVILSGGSGSRLWPVSRAKLPKQLLPLVGDQTMLQETVVRLNGFEPLAESCLVVCNETHRFLAAEQLEEINVPAQLILARKDKLTPLKTGMAFAEELGARVTVIERYGHMLPIEAPRQTLQKLRELIGSLETNA